MRKSSDQKNVFHENASIFILAVAAVFVSFLFWSVIRPRMDFYNELWGPDYLLVNGRSPYDTSSLNPILPAAWLPMAIGFFFPLGWFPETFALQVWYLFNIF